MGDPLYVFGIEILLQDHASPVVADAAIGLYNVNSALSANSAASARHVTVADGSVFTDGEVVTVTDDNGSESATIATVVGNSIAFKTALTSAYTTAASATVHANSRFRWLQQSITGVTGWCSTMLTLKGISPWTRKIRLERGGNIATPGTCTATVKNTSKFWDSLQDKSIYLNGMVFNVWEFQGTAKSRQWWGICEKPDWDAKAYKIPAKGGYNRRRSNLSTLITQAQYPNASGDDVVGGVVPVSFGEFKPKFDEYGNIDYDSYARFVRVANKVDTFSTGPGTTDGYASRISLGDWLQVQIYPPKQAMFPVVGDDGDTPPLSYDVRLGEGAFWLGGGEFLQGGTYAITFFDDQYVHVREGESEDAYRKIENVILDRDAGLPQVLTVAVNSYFEDTLAGNATATAEDNSWVSIEDITRQYESDAWPCRNYLGQTGVTLFGPVVDNLNIYAYATPKRATFDVSGSAETIDAPISEFASSYIRLPDYAFDDNGSDNNTLDISVNHFEGSPDKVSGPVIVAPSEVRMCTDADTSDWNVLDGDSNAMAKIYSQDDAGGELVTVFGSGWVGGTHPAVSGGSGTLANTTDGVSTTEYHREISYPAMHDWVVIYEILPPPFPTGLAFDSLHLGVKCAMLASDNPTTPLRVYGKWRRFIGTPKQIGEQEYFEASTPAGGNADVTIASLPDFYYSDNVDTKDKDYYFAAFTEGTTDNKWTGHVNFEFDGVTDEATYNSIESAALIVGHPDEDSILFSWTHTIRFYEFAWIFKRKADIKKYLYAPYQGRIFNDTWDGRKTAADMITDPLEVMEHACRLQNWGESSTVPANGWGKGYAEGARVAYTGRGSFSAPFFDANISPLINLRPTNQIQKEKQAASDVIKKGLCRDFFLANWADKDGYERVARIVKSETTPSDTVTLADIIDRRSINVEEPNPGDVYCAPFVRYQKNFATGEYQKAIRITNPDAESFDADYVSGLDKPSNEEFWGRCNSLWQKIGFITEPPKSLTDLEWANGDDGDKIAKEYLTEWIDWMFNPTISFKVHYLKAGAWEEAHKFILQLPHQTDNTQIECVLTSARVDPNPPYPVTISAIMLRETIPSDYFYVDTMTAFGNNNDWVDTMTEYGTDRDKIDQM